MAIPVGAVSHAPQVSQARAVTVAKPAANQTKVTPQDSVNISAAGKGQVRRGLTQLMKLVTVAKKSNHFCLAGESTGRDSGLRHNDPGARIAVSFFRRKADRRLSAEFH
jgi:hypothetical protein